MDYGVVMTYSRLFLLVSLIFFLAIGSIVFQHHQQLMAVQSSHCIDIPAMPDYLSSKDPHDAIAAINHARQLEHIHALQLPTNFYQLSPVQQQFVLLNLERVDRKIQPLVMDAMLSQMAQAYSQQMRNLNFFAHSSPIAGSFSERINNNALLYNHYRLAAENLAGNPVAGVGPIYEYMYDDSVEACGHRQNMLDPQLRLVGIGLVFGSPYGSISAQEFLTSASWNPYVSGSAQQVKPLISIVANSDDANHQLRLTAQQDNSDPLVRVTWFLDSPNKPLYVGNDWMVDIRALPKGKHTILAYGVDGVEQYAVACYGVSV